MKATVRIVWNYIIRVATYYTLFCPTATRLEPTPCTTFRISYSSTWIHEIATGG